MAPKKNTRPKTAGKKAAPARPAKKPPAIPKGFVELKQVPPPVAAMPISTVEILRADMDTRETACTAAVEAAASKFNCVIVPVIKLEGTQVSGHVEIRARPPVR